MGCTEASNYELHKKKIGEALSDEVTMRDTSREALNGQSVPRRIPMRRLKGCIPRRIPEKINNSIAQDIA